MAVENKRVDEGRVIDEINLDDAYHVGQWSEIFNVTPAELSEAVQAAGPLARDVRRHLRNR